MKTKKRNALFGRYPSCDMLNNALRFINDGKIDVACAEIVFAIDKAGGYFHEDVMPIVERVRSYWNETHGNGRHVQGCMQDAGRNSNYGYQPINKTMEPPKPPTSGSNIIKSQTSSSIVDYVGGRKQ